MSQLTSVKLSKFDNQPWGFRLHGGKDFGFPLSIQKVNGGSLAEQAGLRVGDQIVKINNIDVYVLRHKEAQDVIMRAGNNFEMQIQRGGMTTWKPQVTPIGNAKPSGPLPTYIQPVTRTSLAANKPAAKPIGTGHNFTAKPFGPQKAQMNGPSTPVKSIVNKQYNSPVAMYSDASIAETLSAQAEVLAGGVLGVNFKKNEKSYDGATSEVLKMVQEADKEPRSPVPREEEQERSLSAGQAFGLRHVKPPEAQPPAMQPSGLPSPGVAASAPAAGSQNICGECERLIVGVFVRIKDKSLHVECFKCAICGTSLKNVGYYNINNKLYCDVHARQVAQRQQAGGDLSPITIPPSDNYKPAGYQVGPSIKPHSPLAAPAYRPQSPSVSSFANKITPQPYNPVSSGGGYSSMVRSSQQSMHSESSYSKTTTSSGNTKVVWPPLRSNEEDAASTGPTATPLYIAPDQPSAVPSFSPVAAPAPTASVAAPSLPVNAPSSFPPTFKPAPAPTMVPTPFVPKPAGFTPGATAAPAPFSAAPAPFSATPAAPAPYSAAPAPQFAAPPMGGGGGGGGGGLGGPRSKPGATVAGAVAPKRGKGILKQQTAGVRVPLCGVCNTQIRGPFITALGKTWCPDHFTCSNGQCRRALNDIGFVEEQSQLYCEYCWENYLAPECSKCHKRIKEDCLKAIGKHFHPDCFLCSYCGRLFGNNPFYLEDGLPYCEGDWNELFTTKCTACGFAIEAGDRWVEALNNNYHSQCFNCTMCKKNLEGQSFFAKGGRPFCKVHAR